MKTSDLRNSRENPSHLRLIHCPILGLSFARNAGISEAASELLLFIDDDATADYRLLEEYIKAYKNHPEAGVIGGHIILERPRDLFMVWKAGWERYWSQFITGYTAFTVVNKWWEYPWGANWLARRVCLMQTGGFRTGYGRKGNDFSGGEEIVAASLIQSLGYTIGVLPTARVLHHVDRERFNIRHIRQTIFAGQFTHYQSQLELRLPYESSPKNSYYLIRKTIGRIVKSALHSEDIDQKASLIETRYQFSAQIQLFYRQIIDFAHRFAKLRKL